MKCRGAVNVWGLCFVSSMLLVWGCPNRSSLEPQHADSQATEDDQGNPARVATRARFVDRAKELHVNFRPENGESAGHLSILETLGAGVALLDVDMDGRLDIWANGGGHFVEGPAATGNPGTLLRRLANSYEETWSAAGLPSHIFYNHGAIASDYNNDGLTDVLVTGYRGLALFENMGDGTFLDVTDQAELTPLEWSTGAAWGDVNGDGVPDLLIANYVDWSFENHPRCVRILGPDVCAPAEFTGLNDRLYLSQGDGTFADESQAQGLLTGGKGLGVLAADLDQDGAVDFYVANDTTPNFHYRNTGRHLEEVGLIAGTSLDDKAMPNGSMGLDVADVDQDGRLDLWVANFENENMALYRNLGDGQFQHDSQRFGITSLGASYVAFGTAFLDFDLDGDNDICVTNGHVMRHPTNAPVLQLPLLLQLDDNRYRNVASQAGEYFATPHMGRGLAVGDLDRDGDQDIVISPMNAQLAVLDNQSVTEAASIQLNLIGRTSARHPVGATVTLRSSVHRQTSQVTSGASFLSTSSPTLCFAVPGGGPVALDIQWPSGTRQRISDISANTRLIVIEGQHFASIP